MTAGPKAGFGSLRALFSDRQWEAAQDYVAQGRLSDLMAAPEGLAGTVRGYQGDYGVTLLWQPPPARAICSFCERPCRHAAALALVYEGDRSAFWDLATVVDAFLSAPDAAALRRAALTRDAAGELRSYLSAGRGLPPRSRLRALGALKPDQRLLALSRICASGNPLLDALPERALRRLIEDLPLGPLMDWCLKIPGGPGRLCSPVVARLESEPPETLLHTLLGLGHLEAAQGKSPGPLLARAIALLPQGDVGAARALAEAFPDEAEAAEALVHFLALSGHPRQALSEAAALAATSPRHLPLAIAQAEAAGSVLEARLRLRALQGGDGTQLDVLALKFPELLDSEWEALVASMAPAGHFDLLVKAAEARKNAAALAGLVTGLALPFGPLTRALRWLTAENSLPEASKVRFDLVSEQAKKALQRQFWGPS